MLTDAHRAPYWLVGRGQLEGNPPTDAGLAALHRIANARTPISWYESSSSVMGREADGYVSGGVSPRSEIRKDVARGLFERRLIAVDLGPIARSMSFYVTSQGMKVLGINSAECEMRWEDSDNLL